MKFGRILSVFGLVSALAVGGMVYSADASTTGPAVVNVCVERGPAGGTNATGNIMEYDWNNSACPSGTYRVQLSGAPVVAPTPTPTATTPTPTPTATTPTPTPTPTVTTPTPTPTVTTATPTPTPTGGTTVSSQWATVIYPPYTVSQDMWGEDAQSVQTLTAYSAGNWSISTYEPTGAPVRAYPDVYENLGNPINSYTTVTASFNETTPSAGSDEAAFDIWINGIDNAAGSTEVMIWTNDHGQYPAGTDTTTATVDGTTSAVWECSVASCGHGCYSFVLPNETSGSVNILDYLSWLENAGLVTASQPLSQVDYGWEIGNTGGTTETFSMNSYSLTAK